MGTFSTWKSSTATRTMFEFIHRDGLEHYRFYRIPKLLMEDDIFRPLSTEAKLLYGLFLDRLELSLMNDWFDEEGRAFIIFTVKEVEHQLHCGHDKAIHLLAELDTPKGIGLIQRQHQGPGIPDRIYVKSFIPPGRSTDLVETSDPVQSENPMLSSPKKRPINIGKSDFKDTDIKETYKTKTDGNETKDTYGAFANVRLSRKEYETLKKEFPRDYEERIEALSEYIAASGRRYKNHLAVIRSWYRREQKNTTAPRHEAHYETADCL